ncbi:nucleoside hydrolase [Pararhodonellum marinum]|uniref:nucleoside hydrolase n=1 Tax=Pararhodonellum marinum TaxID=2755358 RepID=UPI001E31EE2C|nr:nucleoside hydrolase [Pararhodonellum marinum]
MPFKKSFFCEQLSRLASRFCLMFAISCLIPGIGLGQSSGEEKPKIILDTDMGSDCDDVGALALLHQYARMEKADILGVVYSSGKVPYGAAIVEAINVYYGKPDIPVGASHDFEFGDPVDKMLAEKLARDTAAFGHTRIHNREFTEQTDLNRRLLAEQEDNSITYVTIGHTQGLYDLLISEPDAYSALTGRELVQKKVKRWVALGALNAANEEGHLVRDWNFFFNGTSSYTAYLIQHFPKEIYLVDAGSKVLTGKGLQNTPAGNIVRTAYRDWLWNVEKKTLQDQRPSWDLAAVYFAVEGLGEFLKAAPQGNLEFDPEKGCRWVTGGNAKSQFFISEKADISQSFSEYLNALIALPPQ